MKKILTLLSITLLLTACSTPKKLTFKDDKELYKLNGQTFYESDFYELLVQNDRGTTIYSHMLDQLNENSTALVQYANEIDAKVNEEVKKLEESFGEQLTAIINTAGFKSVDSFVEKQLRPSIALQFEMNDYILENIDSIVKDFKIKDVSIFATDDKAFASDIIDQLNDNVDPGKIEIDKKAQLSERLISQSFESGSESVDKKLQSNLSFGISEAIYDEESNLHYIIVNHDTDFSKNIDTLVQLLVESENFTDFYTAKQFNDANFKIFDSVLKNIFDELRPGITK